MCPRSSVGKSMGLLIPRGGAKQLLIFVQRCIFIA
jgi:hypothetical protein